MRGGAKLETNGFNRVIRQRVKSLAGITVTVGIHRGKQHDGVDVATYAAWNNFGTKNAMGWELIPARPFMTYSANHIAGWMKSAAYQQNIKQVVSGKKTAAPVAEYIGYEATRMTRRVLMTATLYKPNSAVTIARKGSGKQVLENNHFLFDTVAYKVHGI